MPQFQSHKKVWALKIKGVFRESEGDQLTSKVTLTFDDGRYAALNNVETAGRPTPEPGWYLVVYEDGYHSFSPAKQFEEGNSPIIPAKEEPYRALAPYQIRVIDEHTELADKLIKLRMFIESPRFVDVPAEERGRLHRQFSAMVHYDNILRDRIAEFPPSDLPPAPEPADQSSFPEEVLDNWFTYHAPRPEQLVSYQKIREAGRYIANVFNRHVPAGADKTAAMRKVREAVTTANQAIACEGR